MTQTINLQNIAGSGVVVQQFVVAGGKPGEYWLVLREMVKLWTSLGELGYYSVTGKLLGDWPLVQRARTWRSHADRFR